MVLRGNTADLADIINRYLINLHLRPVAIIPILIYLYESFKATWIKKIVYINYKQKLESAKPWPQRKLRSLSKKKKKKKKINLALLLIKVKNKVY